MYALDLNILIQYCLPWCIRKIAMVAWLNALIEPLKQIHESFLIHTETTKYEAEITGQVRVLRYHLNRIFDQALEVTIVADAVGVDVVFIFLENENRPVYLPTFLSGQKADFIVRMRSAYASKEAEIRGLLDKYKLPGKQYELIFDIFV